MKYNSYGRIPYASVLDIYIYIYTHIHTYIHIYIYTHTYTHTFNGLKRIHTHTFGLSTATVLQRSANVLEAHLSECMYACMYVFYAEQYDDALHACMHAYIHLCEILR